MNFVLASANNTKGSVAKLAKQSTLVISRFDVLVLGFPRQILRPREEIICTCMRQVWRAAPTACDVAYNPPPLPSAPPVTDLNYFLTFVDILHINQYGNCPPLQCAELAHCGQELGQLVLQSSPFDDIEQPLGRWLAHTHLLQILRLDILKMLHPRNLQLISDSNKELFQLDLKSEIVKFCKRVTR